MLFQPLFAQCFSHGMHSVSAHRLLSRARTIKTSNHNSYLERHKFQITFEELKTNLMSLVVFISLIFAQHTTHTEQ